MASTWKRRRRADDRADVVRIGDLVENEDQRLGPERVDGRGGQGIGFEVKPLVHGVRFEKAVDFVRTDDRRVDPKSAQCFGQATGRVLSGEQAARMARLVAQGLDNGMPAVQNRDLVITSARGAE